MSVAVNPGSGPAHVYSHCRARYAHRNIKQFVAEIGLDEVTTERRPDLDDRDGRYMFLLRRRGKRCLVSMPGNQMRHVRYRLGTVDNAWHFPRLFIGPGGASWLWPFAVDDARSELTYAAERAAPPQKPGGTQ